MFVAEIGLNHKGDEGRALSMLGRVLHSKADAVTFQIAKPEFYERVKKWGGPLSQDFYTQAIDVAHQSHKSIGFAVMDKNIVSFLNENEADFWKTLSSSIYDRELFRVLQKTEKKMFVSTGMSNEEEIINLSSSLSNVTLIHTQLSQSVEDVNLRAISRLKKITGMDVAFGLHCSAIEVIYLTAAFQPSDIFVYVKDEKEESFPDDSHAVLLSKLDKIITELRQLKKAIGTGIKRKMENRLE